jgi:hypothetical protein
VGTEHVLLALTMEPGPAAMLLTERGCDADVIRAEINRFIGPGDAGRKAGDLLASIGIELAEVRGRAQTTFGEEAIGRAALRAVPRRRWHGRRWWPNCDVGRPCESALVGEHSLGAAPRLKRVVQMAAKASSPHRATPLYVLSSMLDEGEGVACRILAERDVNLGALSAAVGARLNLREGA